ncbi:MAG TPA: ABC transporter permease [Bacillota bacterium]
MPDLRLFKNPSFLIGSILIGILLMMMVISFFYTPADPNAMNIQARFALPGAGHILGTDNFGRDILSRIMKGSQIAFSVGFLTLVIGLVAGTLIGSIAGYYGGIVDEVLMKIIDIKMAFPGVLLALMLIAAFGTGINNTLLALGLMAIPRFARVIRSGYLQYKEMDFVKAARARGAGNLRIMYIHILPNLLSPLIVTSSLSFASAVLAEAGLSYLGLGVQPPDPSWGKMLNEAQAYIAEAPWYAVIPGILITMMVLGFNLIGDGLRTVYDVKAD